MNVPLSLRRSNKKIFLLAAAMLLTIPFAGCTLFHSQPKPAEEKKVEKIVVPGMVSANRIAARKRSGTFICLIADSGRPFASFDTEKQTWQGIEPQIMREMAKRMKMKVRFIRMPAKNISAALRNGRGDIAAAKLDTGTIRALSLASVVPYAPAARGELAFMVRSDDGQWQKDLSAAGASVNLKKIVSGNSSTIGSVRVKLADDSDKALPVISNAKEVTPEKKKPQAVNAAPQKTDSKKAKAVPQKQNSKKIKVVPQKTDSKKAKAVPQKQNSKKIKVVPQKTDSKKAKAVPLSGKTKSPKQEKNKK